jgi:hypothetical protein
LERRVEAELHRRPGIGEGTYGLDILEKRVRDLSWLQDVRGGLVELLVELITEASKFVLIDSARASEPTAIGLNSRLVAHVLGLEGLVDHLALLISLCLRVVHLQPVLGRPRAGVSLSSLRHPPRV